MGIYFKFLIGFIICYCRRSLTQVWLTGASDEKYSSPVSVVTRGYHPYIAGLRPLHVYDELKYRCIYDFVFSNLP